MRTDQAAGLRTASLGDSPELRPGVADRLVAVVSGKGGVGKTNVVTNLAVAAAGLGSRVLLVDGDLGLANVDVLLGLTPPRSVVDVLDGSCSLDEALVEGPQGVQILAAASGRSDLAALGGVRMERFLALLWSAASEHDLVLIDAGAGIGPSVIGLAAACARGVVVTNGEPTSLADAYAVLKVLRGCAPGLKLKLLVNAAESELAAHRTHDHLDRMLRRFVGGPLEFLDFLPQDPRLVDAVVKQRAVVEAYPSAAWSRRMVQLARKLLVPENQSANAAVTPGISESAPVWAPAIGGRS